MGFITKFLMRLAKAVLNNVQNSLMQQLNVVQDQVQAPMRAMVQQVTNGIWIGEGANAFVDEVSSLFIPGAGKVAENISGMQRNLNFARDVIDRADEEVDRLVKGRIFDAFGFF